VLLVESLVVYRAKGEGEGEGKGLGFQWFRSLVIEDIG